MNKAVDLMAEAVQKYEGTVAQFLGDGILAFFGAPLAHEDDPQRAVGAALHMLGAAAGLAGQVKSGRDLDFRIRIGINTGPVILGKVGTAVSGTYSAMGDTLNTAARVQSAAEPSSVAVTDRTYRMVSPVFEGEDLGEIETKGKAAPVHVLCSARAWQPMQEAAYEWLLKSERKQVYAAIGAALEKVYPQRTDELAGLLARHSGEAGNDGRALSYSMAAADAALSRYATAEASAHYARAVEIASHSEQDQDRRLRASPLLK